MPSQFEREQMLLGENCIEKLKNVHVAVFGVGGVGGFTAEALARAGIGRITLVDNDIVSLSNLNRQLVALHSTVGQYKTEVMAQRIRDINPDCEIRTMSVFYEPEKREDFFCLDFDYIADCIDSVRCKLDLIETALSRGVPIISSMGTGNRLDPTKFVITDLSKTSGDPLARVMRYELRKRGIVHHTVLTSTELPLTPLFQPEDSSKRGIPGSVSWVPSSAGLMIAGHILRSVLEISRK